MLHKGGSLQRLDRGDESEFSNASIFTSMTRFLRTVNEMEETILLPSRLLDINVGESDEEMKVQCKRSNSIRPHLANTNLYQLYNTISQMKVELLYSQDDSTNCQKHEECPSFVRKLKYARCFSTNSIQRVQSTVSNSDSEFDIGTDNDSGYENDDVSNVIARSFRRHLKGLHRSIHEMIIAAEYVTMRYQTGIAG